MRFNWNDNGNIRQFSERSSLCECFVFKETRKNSVKTEKDDGFCSFKNLTKTAESLLQSCFKCFWHVAFGTCAAVPFFPQHNVRWEVVKHWKVTSDIFSVFNFPFSLWFSGLVVSVSKSKTARNCQMDCGAIILTGFLFHENTQMHRVEPSIEFPRTTPQAIENKTARDVCNPCVSCRCHKIPWRGSGTRWVMNEKLTWETKREDMQIIEIGFNMNSSLFHLWNNVISTRPTLIWATCGGFSCEKNVGWYRHLRISLPHPCPSFYERFSFPSVRMQK